VAPAAGSPSGPSTVPRIVRLMADSIKIDCAALDAFDVCWLNPIPLNYQSDTHGCRSLRVIVPKSRSSLALSGGTGTIASSLPDPAIT
jgi:hypothetical protein